jgi:hypothetical protein
MTDILKIFCIFDLGYVVKCYACYDGLTIVLQSERDPIFLENRVEVLLVKAQVRYTA